LRRFIVVPSPLVAGRLTAATAFVVCAGAAFVQWALAPSLPHSIYYTQVAPDLPGYAVFTGEILDATFDGNRIGIGPISADASAAMRTSLITGHATIAATFLPGRTPPDLAPILAVHDGRRREMFLLSRSGD